VNLDGLREYLGEPEGQRIEVFFWDQVGAFGDLAFGQPFGWVVHDELDLVLVVGVAVLAAGSAECSLAASGQRRLGLA
jgi:hypothetical protein